MFYNKNIYIISDLHINPNKTNIINLFKRFLNYISSKNNQLFILGDFFDFWIGDNHQYIIYNKIISLLKIASRKGLEIFFMRGNRDFLIDKHFANKSGITLIKDPFYLTICNKKIIFSHGDIFCTNDKSYLWYRKWIAYNPIIRFIFNRLSILIKEYIVKNIRKFSYTKNKNYPNIDVTTYGINKYCKGYHIIIHGHTHKMASYITNNYTRYVLGNWSKNINYIKISRDCKIMQYTTLNKNNFNNI